MQPSDVLFALDGVLGQCATAKQLAEALDQSTVPIDSVFASLLTLRALVEQDAEREAVDDDGVCKHPSDAVQRTLVGGGNYLLMCTACNEIIEQSGA